MLMLITAGQDLIHFWAWANVIPIEPQIDAAKLVWWVGSGRSHEC